MYDPFRGIADIFLKNNPMKLFVRGLLGKWYLLFAIPATISSFWVFKHLHDLGVLDKVQQKMEVILDESQSIAQNCVPKLIKNSAKSFWLCAENPPKYAPQTGFEKDLQNRLKNLPNVNSNLVPLPPASGGNNNQSVSNKGAAPEPFDPYDDE